MTVIIDRKGGREGREKKELVLLIKLKLCNARVKGIISPIWFKIDE